MQAVSQLSLRSMSLLRRLLDLSGWRTDVRCNDRACTSIFCLAPYGWHKVVTPAVRGNIVRQSVWRTYKSEALITRSVASCAPHLLQVWAHLKLSAKSVRVLEPCLPALK